MSIDVLVNNVVNKVEMNPNGSVIRFTLANGENHVFSANGDCCNHVWINHLSGLKMLLNRKIVKVEEIPMTDISHEDNSDSYVESFGFKIITDLGYVDLELRNAHNGYYGGWLEYVSKEDLEIYKHFVNDLKEVKEDF